MVSFVAIPFLFQGRFGNVVFSEVTTPWHVAVHAENKEEVLGVVREVFGRDRPHVMRSGSPAALPGDTVLFDGALDA